MQGHIRRSKGRSADTPSLSVCVFVCLAAFVYVLRGECSSFATSPGYAVSYQLITDG